MIDLAAARQPVCDLISTSLTSFAAEKPGVTWSTFALYSCPWSGWVTTCFDTKANSDRIVAEFQSADPQTYGEDGWGRFNKNCPDFEFVEWRLASFPEWQTECETAEPVHVRDLSGQDHFIGEADEEINNLVFPFLCAVLAQEFSAVKDVSLLPRSRHRFGVQMLDSECFEFWRGGEPGA